MTLIKNKLGEFYIKHKMTAHEISRYKSSDMIKCFTKAGMICTIFDKNIISNSTFFIIN